MGCRVALEAVQRLDVLLQIERGINGKSPDELLATRQELSASLVAELHTWLTEQVVNPLEAISMHLDPP